MVAHAHIQLPIVLPKKICSLQFFLYGTGKLCSEFGEDRSISDVAILSTDAGRTDGRTDVYVILLYRKLRLTYCTRNRRLGRHHE